MSISGTARRALLRIWIRGALIIVPLLIMPLIITAAARWYRLLALVVLVQVIWSSVRVLILDRRQRAFDKGVDRH